MLSENSYEKQGNRAQEEVCEHRRDVDWTASMMSPSENQNLESKKHFTTIRMTVEAMVEDMFYSHRGRSGFIIDHSTITF